jgi:hypothetical protein
MAVSGANSGATHSEVTKFILDFVAQPNAILFAGAGVGGQAGLPVWHEYLEHLALAAEAYESDIANAIRRRVTSGEFGSAAHLYKRCAMPEGEKFDKLAEPFGPTKYDSVPLRPLLSLPFSAAVTTNFDHSIHDAWAGAHQRAAIEASLGDATLRRVIHQKDFYVARLHGVAEVPESIVIDDDDLKNVAENVEYQDFLFHILSRQSCLFVGFSFVDPAIGTVLDVFRSRVGPAFPNLHAALLPASAGALRDRLHGFNVKVLLYDDSDGSHSVLWRGIRDAARQSRKASLQPVLSEFPAALEAARHLLVSSYVHAKTRPSIEPLRDQVIRGMLIGLVAEEGSGIGINSLTSRLKMLVPLTWDETKALVEPNLRFLKDVGLCKEDEEGALTCALDRSALDLDLARLVEGTVNRLRVRSSYQLNAVHHERVREIFEDVVLMRGWDLGAQFAGASTPSAQSLPAVVDTAVTKHLAMLGQPDRQKVIESIYNLLTSPSDQEAEILAQLGRLAFGVDVVLQHGRGALQHEVLPELVYLDANVLMPAIVPGHPIGSAYWSAIERWRDAAKNSGLSTRVIVAGEFLNEIVANRRIGEEKARQLKLDDLRNSALIRGLEKYYDQAGGQHRANAFIAGYGSDARTTIAEGKEPESFSMWMKHAAPFVDPESLATFLHRMGIETEYLEATASDEEKLNYGQIYSHLQDAYDKDPIDVRDKAPILVRHEARQLARIQSHLNSGERVLFASADNRLRRLAVGRWLGYVGNSIISHIGFIDLVDFMVGLPVDSKSIARLMWGVRYLDDSNPHPELRNYFTNLALREYNAAMALALPVILDHFVNEVVAEARRQRISFERPSDEEKRIRLLDSFEEKFYESLAEEMDKLRS